VHLQAWQSRVRVSRGRSLLLNRLLTCRSSARARACALSLSLALSRTHLNRHSLEPSLSCTLSLSLSRALSPLDVLRTFASPLYSQHSHFCALSLFLVLSSPLCTPVRAHLAHTRSLVEAHTAVALIDETLSQSSAPPASPVPTASTSTSASAPAALGQQKQRDGGTPSKALRHQSGVQVTSERPHTGALLSVTPAHSLTLTQTTKHSANALAQFMQHVRSMPRPCQVLVTVLPLLYCAGFFFPVMARPFIALVPA
jgi:hypothetical protein